MNQTVLPFLYQENLGSPLRNLRKIHVYKSICSESKDVLVVDFLVAHLRCRWLSLRVGRLVPLTGCFRGLLLRFGRESLRLRLGGLRGVDRCEDYGRLEGDKNRKYV